MIYQQYTDVNLKCAQLIAKSYSTSFSLGIRMFHSSIRQPIYAIYSFARYADEIVDTFHKHDKKNLLETFVNETFDSINAQISLNPVLDAFQFIVNKYQIDHELIHAFFTSMEMDLETKKHDKNSYSTYVYGSAEVIGLMCLQVFCHENPNQYKELEPYAKALGAAFQKINFLRDIKADFVERGREYFPELDFNNFSDETKRQLESEIEDDFEMGLNGIKKLPQSAKFGVYLAYIYYYNLFKKIKKTPFYKVQSKRIRVRNSHKIYLLAQSALRTKLNLL